MTRTPLLALAALLALAGTAAAQDEEDPFASADDPFASSEDPFEALEANVTGAEAQLDEDAGDVLANDDGDDDAADHEDAAAAPAPAPAKAPEPEAKDTPGVGLLGVAGALASALALGRRR